MESGGNGWTYTDADILGMVAPLKFAADDRFVCCGCGAARDGSRANSVIDVGCGDGYFLSRVLHFYSRYALRSPPPLHADVDVTPLACRHRLAVVGVDIMDFYIYTARARFVSISSQLQASHEGAMRYGTRRPHALFPAACLGSGLDLRWIGDGTFNKYVALSPINHFDDQVCGARASPALACCAMLTVIGRGARRWCARRTGS